MSTKRKRCQASATATHTLRGLSGSVVRLLPLTLNNVHLPQCFLIVAGKNVPTLLIGNLKTEEFVFRTNVLTCLRRTYYTALCVHRPFWLKWMPRLCCPFATAPEWPLQARLIQASNWLGTFLPIRLQSERITSTLKFLSARIDDATLLEVLLL